MTIIESLVRLRDDLKKWVTNNLLFLDRRTQHIEDDGSGALNITDPKGNLILRVDEDGVKTTAVEADELSGRDDTSLTVQDEDGNVIMRVDENGVETTEVTAERVNDRGGEDLRVMDEDGNTILRVDEDGLETTVVKAQRLVVNGKDVGEQGAPVSDYNDLENAPDIEDDESAELVVTDPDGNVVMRVDKDGIDAVGVKVGGKPVGSESVQYTEQELTEEQKAQARANIGAVSADEVDTGDATMENIVDDESGELTVQDPNGNPILRVDEFGLETTRVVAGGVDLGAALAALDHGDVIYAIYGETTYAEVKAAADEGKVVLCLHGGRIYELATFYSVTYEGVTKYYAQFWAIPDSGQAKFLAVQELDGESTWGHSGTYRGEGMHNKVKEITEESTDIQYPSAKAVWTALQGVSIDAVSADKVVFPRDMYTAYAMGNVVLENGRGKYASEGDNLADVLDAIWDKESYPETTDPSVSLTFSQAKAYEVGTSVTPSFSAALNPGSYTYGPDTGITATAWEVTDTDGNKATAASGSFPAFVVADGESYKITAKATHGAGAVPVTNKGNEYADGQIAAGSKSATSGAVTGYRNSFYGTLTAKTDLTSDIIRGLTKSGKALANGSSFTITVPVGAMRAVFAYPATLRDVTSVKDSNGMNAEIASSFTKSTLDVEGAADYDAISYKVYVLDFAEALGKANTFKVTI